MQFQWSQKGERLNLESFVRINRIFIIIFRRSRTRCMDSCVPSEIHLVVIYRKAKNLQNFFEIWLHGLYDVIYYFLNIRRCEDSLGFGVVERNHQQPNENIFYETILLTTHC